MKRNKVADPQGPLSVAVAGGGTAGHIEPAMAVAEAVMRADKSANVIALGTPKGLESTLVPQRGFELQMIPPVPVPRKLSRDLASLPWRLRQAIREAKTILQDAKVDVLIGFGGYVSAPSYFAARRLGIPFYVHEANARAGMSNKLGVRLGGIPLAAVGNSGLVGAEVIGIPVKESVLTLDRAAKRDEAREFFGLNKEDKVLLVTGGSQGAASINDAMIGAAEDLHEAGVSVLHAYGRKNSVDAPEFATGSDYVAVPYINRMDLALAAADMIVCRSGAMTVAEVSAVGLPAVYVPLPHGNGEQELNARPVVSAGGGVIVPDAELSPKRIISEVLPVLRDEKRLSAAAKAAALAGHRTAADDIAAKLIKAAGK